MASRKEGGYKGGSSEGMRLRDETHGFPQTLTADGSRESDHGRTLGRRRVSAEERTGLADG